MAIPIIGSGFDEIARQQQFWGDFNRRQENLNLERFNRAQEEQNQYLRQLAADRQQIINEDTARAYNEANVGATLALNREAMQRQSALDRERMAADIERSRVVHANDMARQNQDLDMIASWASSNAPKAQELFATLTKAQRDFEASTAELNDTQAQAKTDPELTIDKSGFAEIRPGSTLGPVYAQLVNQKMMRAAARADQAREALLTARRQLDDLSKIANQMRLTVLSDGTMSSAAHGGRVFGSPTPPAASNPLTAGVPTLRFDAATGRLVPVQ